MQAIDEETLSKRAGLAIHSAGMRVYYSFKQIHAFQQAVMEAGAFEQLAPQYQDMLLRTEHSGPVTLASVKRESDDGSLAAPAVEHMTGKHDQKTHGNKFGTDDKGEKILLYKGGSGGYKANGLTHTKGKVTPLTPPVEPHKAAMKIVPMTKEEMTAQSAHFAHLLDASNTQEKAGQTKQKIAQELAQKLEGNPEFATLAQHLADKGMLMSGITGSQTEKACATLIHQWANSSGDTQALSVAMQQAAESAFHLNGSMWFSSSVQERVIQEQAQAQYGSLQPGMQAFLHAQYQHTQNWFASQGISDVTVYRGAAWSSGDTNKPSNVSFASSSALISSHLQPMSSFSANVDTSMSFANNASNHLMTGASIPVSRILGTCQTGYGCKNESEVVVLGKTDTMWSYSWTGSQSTATVSAALAQATTLKG